MAKAGERDDRQSEYKNFAIREPEVAVLVDRPLQIEEMYRDAFDLYRLLGQMYDVLRDPHTSTPIKGLNNLQELYLNNTQVSDLEPIKGLNNLQELYLSNTQVSSLEPIKGLVNLQNLSLSNTQVSNLELIKELTNLQELILFGTKVSGEQVEDFKEGLAKTPY